MTATSTNGHGTRERRAGRRSRRSAAATDEHDGPEGRRPARAPSSAWPGPAASRRPTSTSATRTTSARACPACGCSPRCTSAARSAASATSPRTAECCWSATTPAATSRRTRSSSRSRSRRTSGSSARFHQLAHNLVLSFPGLSYLRKYGTVAASHENARKALEAGAAVLVYPGGDYDVHRPSWQRNRIDFGGRKGFIRLALDQDVPIVPVVAVGGQETALFLSRGESLATRARAGPPVPAEGAADLAGPARGGSTSATCWGTSRFRPRSPSRRSRRSTCARSSGRSPTSTRSTTTSCG